MKVCIVNTFYYPDIVGGAEISVQKLAEELAKKEVEVHILCTGQVNKDEKINGVFVHRVKIKNLYPPIKVSTDYRELNKIKKKLYSLFDNYNILNFVLLKRELKKIDPDIIHLNNIGGFSCIIWNVAKIINIPIVQTLRDYSLLSKKGNLKDNFKNMCCSYISRNVNVSTAPSKFTLNEFMSNGYFSKSKSKVVYNAIDFCENDIKEILETKIKELILKNKVKFVYLGRLEKDKGIKFLITSFSNVNCENIELIIAGKGSEEKFIIDAERNDKRIKYIGFLDEAEIKDLLLNSDVLIIPSIWPEPFGRVIIEAYKYSMPVIGTRSGGIPEIIIDNITGKLVQPNNANQLISAIKYYSDKRNILNIITNCYNEVHKYSIENHSNEFIEIYKSICR